MNAAAKNTKLMRRILTLIPFLLLGSCTREETVTDWRLVISLPQASLPVQLHLAPDASEAWFVNGPERVKVPQVSRLNDDWVLRFPAFNNTLHLRQEDDRLSGTLTLVKRGYEQVMEVNGAPDPGYRFSAEPRPSDDVTGRWEITFREDDGTETLAVGEFDQLGARVFGTILTPTGDYRYLAGEMDGSELRLSTFDGAHAFVFAARLQEDGELIGDFWSGTKWHERWVARRNFDAQLPDPYALTYIKEGYAGLEFTFPGLSGQPVALSDEKFRGKVVLVTLSGSWCPNCADEMEFLSAYYRANRHRGLEIITLLYEHFEDFERAAEQGRALVQKHAIDFDVLVAGTSDKTLAAETLPMLNHVLAYPTTIFIDRDGEVRHIHTGFNGPGTGEHYEQFKREFASRMDALLDPAGDR